MKFAFVTASVSRNGGGVSESIRALARTIQSQGHAIAIYGVEDDNTRRDIDSWYPVDVNTFPLFGPQRLSYAPGLSQALKEYDCDIVHSHSLWNHTSIAVSRWNKRTGKPYVVHPHGMLDPWALKNSYFAKSLLNLIYESCHLKNSACIRALNESEARSIRAYGLKNPICIIPNGIEMPGAAANDKIKDVTPLRSLKDASYKTLLYLGRIHPKKGLIELLHAWKRVRVSRSAQDDSWALAIAGWDEKGHEAKLKGLVTELQIPSIDMRQGDCEIEASLKAQFPVVFLGPLFGDAKAACYQTCDGFILPSLSEGLPMTVLEAWSFAKPVLMTPECNLPQGFADGAAIRLEIQNLEFGLSQFLNMSDEQRQNMGKSGRALAEQAFAWPIIAREITLVSQWILRGGTPPECVRMC